MFSGQIESFRTFT